MNPEQKKAWDLWVAAGRVMRIDGGVYRGCHPTQEMYPQLQALGVTSAINLESGVFEWVNGCKDVDYHIGGIAVAHLKWNPLLPPTLEELWVGLSYIIRWKNRGVYFHCKDGVDRTGVMAAAYRVWVQKWDIEKAIAEMKEIGFHRFRFCWWLPIVRTRLARGRAAGWGQAIQSFHDKDLG